MNLTDNLFNAWSLCKQEGLNPGDIKGDGFVCCCPLPTHGKGRGDKNPSLSVYVTPFGKIKFKCHAGCDSRDIESHLGITPEMLGYGLSKDYEAVYDYYTEDNVLLYQIVRKPGKKFLARRIDPDDESQWVWNLKKVKPIPYNLPECLRAPMDQYIYVVEGEKDVETLRKHGFVATCNHGGAGKWGRNHASYFKDRKMVVLCDGDEPGLKHQKMVADSLVALAALVLCLPPFKGVKDVTDWFALGHKPEELEEIVSQVSRSLPPVATRAKEVPETTQAQLLPSNSSYCGQDLMAKVMDPPVWVVPGLICEGLCIFAGKPKSGKSWIALEMGMAVASGQRALGLGKCDPGEVLIVSLEDSERRIQYRMKQLGGMYLERESLKRLFFTIAQAPSLSQLDYWLRQADNPKLIVIDTFGRWREPQEKQQSLYDYDTQVAAALQTLALKHKVCICLVHHTRKATDEADPLVEISGSFGLSGAADTILVMRRKRGADEAELFVTGRDIDEARHRMEFKREIDEEDPLEHTGWQITGQIDEDQPSVEGSRRKIIDVLGIEKKAMCLTDIVAATGISYAYCSRVLKRMTAEGLLVCVSRGTYDLPERQDKKSNNNNSGESVPF